MSPILKESKNVCSLKGSDGVVGLWDRMRIEQTLINLLSNAAKYAPGTPVDIEVSSNNGLANLAVKDHGPGISPDNLECIFDSFHRIHDHTPTTGLGLGLYITKEIIEAHRGSIRVESQIGSGATFKIELPLSTHASKTMS
jgi:signal transduction histidine kinase